MSMSRSVCGAVHTLLSPEPRRLSLLLPGDWLRVRENDASFQGSWRDRSSAVGLGLDTNSSVVGLSGVCVPARLSWWAAGGADARVGGLRRGTNGSRLDGSGKWGIVKVSQEPGRRKKDIFIYILLLPYIC